MRKLDLIVAEHGESRMYIHRAQADPRVIWAKPAASVEEALTFNSVEEAETFLAETYPDPEQFTLVYLATALAKDDQEYSAYLRNMRC